MALSEKAIVGLACGVFISAGTGLYLYSQKVKSELLAHKYDIICMSGGVPVLQAGAVTDYRVGDGAMHWSDGKHEYHSTAECIARRAL